MDVVNLMIGLASLVLSGWALGAATSATRAIARFQSQTRRIDCLLKLQQAITMAQRLTASRGARLSQQDLDHLRRLMTETCSSPEITGADERNLRLAIAQVRVVPDNMQTARFELRKLEEELLSISAALRDAIEEGLK